MLLGRWVQLRRRTCLVVLLLVRVLVVVEFVFGDFVNSDFDVDFEFGVVCSDVGSFAGPRLRVSAEDHLCAELNSRWLKVKRERKAS